MIALIPARGGSKGIPRKNLALLNGKPLICWTIEAAIKSDLVDDLYVTTDDKEIADISESYGAKIIARPTNLAEDNSPVIDALQHAVGTLASWKIDFDQIILTQATSPLRSEKHINEAIKLFRSKVCKSLVSVQKVPHIFNPDSTFKIKDNGIIEHKSDTVGRLQRQKKKL